MLTFASEKIGPLLLTKGVYKIFLRVPYNQFRWVLMKLYFVVGKCCREQRTWKSSRQTEEMQIPGLTTGIPMLNSTQVCSAISADSSSTDSDHGEMILYSKCVLNTVSVAMIPCTKCTP